MESNSSKIKIINKNIDVYERFDILVDFVEGNLEFNEEDAIGEKIATDRFLHGVVKGLWIEKQTRGSKKENTAFIDESCEFFFAFPQKCPKRKRNLMKYYRTLKGLSACLCLCIFISCYGTSKTSKAKRYSDEVCINNFNFQSNPFLRYNEVKGIQIYASVPPCTDK